MKTILVLSISTAVAHLVRPLEVGKVLREMGYRVVFAGSGPALALVQQAGFEVRPLPELDFAWAMARLWQGPQAVHLVENIETWVQAEIALLRDLRPNAVLHDGRPTASTSAAIAGRPLISLANAYITPYAVNGLLDQKLPGPPSIMGPGAEVPYNVVRRQYGLPELAKGLDLLTGDLNLMCDVPEYAPVRNAPANFRYVGPIVWNGTPQPPPWLDTLGPARPTIYFTMGSTGQPGSFKVAIEAFGDTGYQVMITTGGVTRPEDLLPVPSNCHLARFGPGDVLMQRADVAVCHGGNGTTYQALYEGVPIVAWPYLADQHWNARRQAELGIGFTLSAPSPETLRAAVEEALTRPHYRAAAERFRQILAGYDGPRTAAQLIHESIGQRPSTDS